MGEKDVDSPSLANSSSSLVGINSVHNNVIKIIRNKDAKTSAIPVVGSNGSVVGDEMVTRVVEVKNVTMAEGNYALFPDAVTTPTFKFFP